MENHFPTGQRSGTVRSAESPAWAVDMAFRGRVGRQLIEIGKDREQCKRFKSLFDRGFVSDLRVVGGTQRGGDRAVLNGFVLPVGDSLIGPDGQGRPGIMSALAQAAQVIGKGAGMSIDFSPLRTVGARVGKTGCEAAGPTAYVGLFDTLRGIVQAPEGDLVPLIAVLHVGHPDIEMFVSDLAETAVDCCVAVPDDFMRAMSGHKGVGHADAHPDGMRGASTLDGAAGADWVRELWHLIFDQSAGESIAMLFPDAANRRNSLRYCEQLHAPIHPGGPLLPSHGAFAGGTLMLPAFVATQGAGPVAFDWPSFGAAIGDAVEYLDRALDITDCPLPEQQVELQNKRRIGLSCTGMAQTLSALDIQAGSAQGLAFTRQVWSVMRDGAFLSSVELARALGAFPLFNADGYLRPGGFASTLAPALQNAIRRHGIRNANLLAASMTVDEKGDCANLDDGLDLLAAMAPLVDGGVGMLLPQLYGYGPEAAADVVTRAWRAGANAVRIGP